MKKYYRIFLLLLFVIFISVDKVSSLADSHGIMAKIRPIISIDNTNNISSKLVNIKCQKEYRCEYSLDLINWSEFQGKILVSKTSTIYARTVDSNNNVVRSSSFKIIID